MAWTATGEFYDDEIPYNPYLVTSASKGAGTPPQALLTLRPSNGTPSSPPLSPSITSPASALSIAYGGQTANTQSTISEYEKQLAAMAQQSQQQYESLAKQSQSQFANYAQQIKSIEEQMAGMGSLSDMFTKSNVSKTSFLPQWAQQTTFDQVSLQMQQTLSPSLSDTLAYFTKQSIPTGQRESKSFSDYLRAIAFS